MTIAPVVKTIETKAPPDLAFRLFTERMSAWWPSRMSIGPEPPADIVVEPGVGGRWFERTKAGVETDWGRVLIWEPPQRLVLAWQIDATFCYDPEFETELELTFETSPMGARVRLEHRNLERLGESAARIAEQMRGGWAGIIEGFAKYSDHLSRGESTP